MEMSCPVVLDAPLVGMNWRAMRPRGPLLRKRTGLPMSSGECESLESKRQELV